METQFETLKDYAKPRLVPDRFRFFLRVFAFSILLASIPSLISIVVALGTLTAQRSLFHSLLLWNIYFASWLVETGVLPVCENCEMMSLLDILFWGFLIGIIGYCFLMFLVLILKYRRQTSA
jgi:hypothetical protein